ncbi:hypothetical protein DENSPDRAFT_837692 [Dentipellis sp. KUC8613]|nr:hypothetical protein DENSPDRAFT_837692 [Dentipellis sp. KUC8613]
MKAISKRIKGVKESLKRSKKSPTRDATRVPPGSPAGVESSQQTVNVTNAPNVPARAASPEPRTNVTSPSLEAPTDAGSSQQVTNGMWHYISTYTSTYQLTITLIDNGVCGLLKSAIIMALNVVKESSDAFPPLKGAVGGICSIINSVDVMKGNTQETARLTALTIQLVEDHANKWMQESDNNIKMKKDMSKIAKEAGSLHKKLEEIANQSGLVQFIKGGSNAADLKSGYNEIKDAFEEYDRILLEHIHTGVQTIQKGVSNIESRQDRSATKQTLAKLEHYCSTSAPYDAYIGNGSGITRRACTNGTRVHVLDQILAWLRSSDRKSTIAYTICDQLSKLHPGTPFVSYFCSRQLDSHAPERLLPTLCCYLAQLNSIYASHLAAAIDGNLGLLTAILPTQLQKLFVKPWEMCFSEAQGAVILVVIDALDENLEGYKFLELLLEAVHTRDLKGIKFLITSCTDNDIAEYCDGLPQCWLQRIPLNEVQIDIRKYLNEELAGYDSTLLDAVTEKADGLFIYAATVVRILEPDSKHPENGEAYLRQWLHDSYSIVRDQVDIPPVYMLYLRIINSWLDGVQRLSLRDTCLHILKTIMCGV